MNPLEERLRQGLDVEMSVSADEMIGAAVARVRQHRRRRTAAIVTATVGAVAAVAIAIAATDGNPSRKSGPPEPVKTPEVQVAPDPTDWFADLATDGTTLYLTTHRCPGKVSPGHCSAKDGFWGGRSPVPMKAYPVDLWRYADTTWERVGQPDVSSHAQMLPLPGGVLFVPIQKENGMPNPTGPLRVSLDRGQTWVDWELPWPNSRCDASLNRSCAVAVAGDYVVATSGDAWVRRNIDSREWEDISPPVRRPINDFDELGWGLLALDDGTLVATANNINPVGPGFYRTSRDFGSTWSAPHDNPGQSSTGGSWVDTVVGSVAYAECWELVPGYGGDSSRGCGYYRSTDLERWTKARIPPGHDPDPNACSRAPSKTWRVTDSAVRVGDFVYAIGAVHVVNGHAAAVRKEFTNLDAPHRLRHVLEFSTDDCRSWAPMLD